MSVLSTILEAQLAAKAVWLAAGEDLNRFDDLWAFTEERDQIAWLEEHVAPFGTHAADLQRRAWLLAIVRFYEATYLHPLLVNARAVQTELEDLIDRAYALREKRDARMLAFDHLVQELREGLT